MRALFGVLPPVTAREHSGMGSLPAGVAADGLGVLLGSGTAPSPVHPAGAAGEQHTGSVPCSLRVS